jgi:hypothetical protein
MTPATLLSPLDAARPSDQITRASTWRRLLVNGRTPPGHRSASTACAQALLTSTSGFSSS